MREQLHFASLERIFIEERIYKDREYEESENRQEAIDHIRRRFEPWLPKMIREITDDDIIRLFEIKMGRILKFNSRKCEEQIAAYLARIDELNHHLAHLTEYTIEWYQKLKTKYGAAYPRMTQIRSFDNIQAATVAEANEKLYINREEGFIGTGLKKDEFLCNCSSIDDVIIFYKDGRYKVVKVQDKLSVGKGVIHVDVFKRNDERTIYNVIYQNGKGGTYYMKRFRVTGITRDREYNLTPGEPGSKICWFTANPNGEAEVVKVTLKPKQRLKTLQFDVDFSELAIKGRGAMGNIVTRNEAHRFTLKKEGVSTLGGRDVWYDPDVNRLNYEGRGRYLGEFNNGDYVLVITNAGEYYTSSFEASNHYPDNVMRIEKYVPHKAWTAILNDADQGYPYLKRFTFEPTSKPQRYLGENDKSTLILLSDEPGLRIEVTYAGADAVRPPLEVTARDFVAVKSYKAKGKRLTTYPIDRITELEPVEAPGVDDDDEVPQPDGGEEADETAAEYVERSDDEVRDEITGQTRLFE